MLTTLSFLLTFVPGLFFSPPAEVKPFAISNTLVTYAKTPLFVHTMTPVGKVSPVKLSILKIRYAGLTRAELIANAAPVYATPSASPVEADGPKVPSSVHPLLTHVDVVAEQTALDTSEGFQRPITPREVETSAGTFGDLSRFLQTVAGVTGDNDQRNDVLVRGGNPSENLFVIDNIEIPSINQLALSDTTGGFVSMLDANAIQQILLHEDAYDSKFEERLSSVVDISTRPSGAVTRKTTSEFGIAGTGGSMVRPLGQDGSLFVSVRRSMMQDFTNDIGLNGVPVYENGFVRAEEKLGDRDTVWGISLTGIDSMVIHPDARDPQETNPFHINYSGWRNTTGVNWQHMFSSKLFGIASVAHSAQSQAIAENGQLQNGNIVYKENTSDGITTVKYDATWQANNRVMITGGARAAVDEINYTVAQPIGLQSPYSETPAPIDAGGFAKKFGTVSSSAYVEGTVSLPKGGQLVLGERAMSWALGGNSAETGKALLALPILGHMVHVGYAQLEQMPSTLYLMSFNNLHTLKPIKSDQATAGITLTDTYRARVTLETYNKTYSDYPVAANIPQLSLANVADSFGQAFLLFPMVAKGDGIARGVELTTQTHATSRLDLTATLAYSRSMYTGLDGIWHRGNFDVPLAANFLGVWKAGRGLTLSWRETATSGKTYTPDNWALSSAQNRDVYDLTKINGKRGTAYARLDFRIEQSHKLGMGILTWHAGVQNALNRKNFYEYQWQANLTEKQAALEGIPYGPSQQNQMPLLPDGGVKYTF